MLKSIKASSIGLLLATILMSNLAVANSQEKLAIQKQGIKVWTIQAENNPMAQYRAETTFNTTLENAVGLILDTERSAKWIPNVGQIKVIERNDTTGSFIAYMTIKMPFPLTDRDLVIKGEMRKEKDGRVIVTNKAIKDARLPEKSGFVRIKQYEGDWVFQKLSEQSVKVTTRGYADPSGSIPKGIVNSFVQQQPYQMFQKMREQVKTIQYTQQDLPKSIQ